MADSDADQELADRYRFYLGLCGSAELDRLDEVVAPELLVEGVPTTRAAYVAQIAAVLAAFPDYRWQVRHLVVNRPLLAAHLVGRGTHTGTPWLGRPAAGATVTIPEHAVYSWSGGLVREVWSTTDRLDTLHQLGGQVHRGS